MRGFIFRVFSSAFYFLISFIIWFVLPMLLVESFRLELFDLEKLFYMALLISLLACLSKFYGGSAVGLAFSTASDLAILAYLFYSSNGGRLLLRAAEFAVNLDVTNLLMVLSLPLVISIVGKVWRLATMEAERRVRMVEEG